MNRLVIADAVRTAEGVVGDALLVRHGTVAALGTAADLRRPGLAEDRFPGSVIVPGLRDAHFHPVSYTAAIMGLSLKEAADFAEVFDLLRSAASALSNTEPLVALRLDDESLAEGRLPSRDEIDAAVGDRPVLLHRYCGHVGVANSAALHAGGIDRATPDPPGGVIDRDGDGEPTGVLRETAMEIVSAALQPALRPTPGQLTEALNGLAGLGLTSLGAIVGCGDGPWASLGDETELLVDAAPTLPIRLKVMVIAGSPAEYDRVATRLSGLTDRLEFIGLKRFSDGSLGGHTAAMATPFADRPDTSGALRLDPTIDGPLAAHALSRGHCVAIHAIGDDANTAVLDLFEGLEFDQGQARIEHASVLHDADIPRFAQLGVTASIQPAFLASERSWLETRLGRERMRRAYPFRSLAESGATLAGGSDCPVEPPHPLWGMATARDRAGMDANEGLSADQAFGLFTTGAARAMQEPEPLAIGSPADFVVIDRDPVTASPEQLRSTDVLATFLDGIAVTVDPSWEPWTG